MDKAAPRRSLRIQKRKIANDRKDYGEPESKKRATGTSRKSLDGEKSSNRDRKRSETGGSSTSPKPCSIQQLPSEVLAIIFSYSNSTPRYGWNGLNLRLVCKEWCDTYGYHTDANVYFKKTVPHVRLGNCGFRRLAVRFHRVDLSKLPQSMWQKIGYKIHSLKLQICTVGDQALKNVIMYCCNLRSLEVLISDYPDDGHSFCSAEMLRELCINNKNLKTFKINSTRKSIDVTNWTEIFEAFLTIYPCIINYTAGHYLAYTNKFEFGFSNEVNVNNLNATATTLALLLSLANSNNKQALDIASTLRLVGFSLCKWDYIAEEADEDVAKLVKFFSNGNNLECVKMRLNWRISNTMLKSFLLQIVSHCCKLRKLSYRNKNSKFCPNFDLAEPLLYQLCTICPSLDELSVDSFKLLVKQSSLSFATYSRRSTAKYMSFWEQCLRRTINIYPDLQHLALGHSICTDEMLQSIFEYLVNLKTLSVRLRHSNTNKGITGNSHNVPDVCSSRVEIISDEDGSNLSGYSINRLKSLEKLVLLGYCRSQMNDTIFYELDFPNLRYLRIDPPDDSFKLFPVMAQNMPSLETISFGNVFDNRPEYWSSKFWTKAMFPFVRQMKKLRTMKLERLIFGYLYGPRTLTSQHVVELFGNSESLHEIAGACSTIAHHLRDSKKIVLFDVESKWNIITTGRKSL